MRTKHYEVEQYFAEETGMILASAFFDCSILIDDKMLSVYSAGEHLSQIQKNIKTSMHFFFLPKERFREHISKWNRPKIVPEFLQNGVPIFQCHHQPTCWSILRNLQGKRVESVNKNT
jgi:hypothetical protein